MLLNGKKVTGPNVEYCVIPRKEGNLVFKFTAVLDFDKFEQLCPTPQPPEIIRPGNVRSLNPEDSTYQKNLIDWATRKTHWMFLESIRYSEGIEWETVDYSDPKTWENYLVELKESGFSEAEVARLIFTSSNVCGLNQEKINEATEQFLAGMEGTLENVSSPSTEQNSMQSGEPVKESE